MTTKKTIDLTMVIVTYNRLEKLKKVVESIEKQDYFPNKIIVVNNGCTDDTSKFLSTLDDKYLIINTGENLGGSGGFFVGEKEAINLESSWIWLSDDDAYLGDGLFSKLSNILHDVPSDVGAICTNVVDYNGISYPHRRRISKSFFKIFDIPVPNYEYKNESFDIDIFSYVGTILRKTVLQEVGLVNPEYFIWKDDTEHSIRIRKKYRIICYPILSVFHDTVVDTSSGPSWKDYYGIRNWFHISRIHFGRRYTLYIRLLQLFNVKDKKMKIICKTAYKDYKHKRFGKSNIYYPGCKI